MAGWQDHDRSETGPANKRRHNVRPSPTEGIQMNEYKTTSVITLHSRKCDVCGIGMDEGYYNEGSYYCDDSCLPYTKEEWEEIVDSDDENNWYSTWYGESPEYITIDGVTRDFESDDDFDKTKAVAYILFENDVPIMTHNELPDAPTFNFSSQVSSKNIVVLDSAYKISIIKIQ